MSVDRVEIFCENCLEAKRGGGEYEGIMLCLDCFKEHVLGEESFVDGPDDDDEWN
jgi:hypothetical protein